ncbi:receptor-like serine/threonine-protein kinase SD1-8 [Argentina anserina]|uniref:receptor-like serine/threonine-protein kinase SD1-8 n=1 Tax=Argentina anserina TaxID=57926 RepID=UPI0021767510|nr:receptor-like serine/threonine-protein kinase SD1-8 [Potentilla anserina]
MALPHIIISLIIFSSFFPFPFPFPCHAITDTLTISESLRDNQTLVSAGGVFVLGFFIDSSSGNHYLGIWLKADAKRVVWVAYREIPILDSSGVLQIRAGNLVISDRRQLQLIVNSGNVAATTKTSATLLDTGNLVLKDENTGNVTWQSFDVPTNTYLPGMKIGLFDLNTTQQSFQILTSWASPQNPNRGVFTLSIDRIDFTKIDVWRGDGLQMHIAFWDGHDLRFIFENTTVNNDYDFSYKSIDGYEAYYTFSHSRKYDLMWFVMASTGNLDQYFMVNGKITSVSHALCEDSGGGNSGKCLTSLPPMCGDTFNERNGSTGSLPSTVEVESIDIGASDCETLCKSNCSCTAYVSVQSDRSVCQLYYGSRQELMKIMEKGGGTIYYVRGSANTSGGKKWKRWLTVVLPVVFLSALISIFLFCYLRWRRGPKGSRREVIVISDEVRLFQIGSSNASPIQFDPARVANLMELNRSQKDQELPFFTFSDIKTATNDFAKANKLGEGGFGPVYKGRLLEGQNVAVKRLSELSRQGLEEFKNEVLVICKLQHRNLVRILGCCIEGEESILVYEYMPNKSLDSFIFNSAKRALLDWKKRIKIIEGIAQGLLYLHKYSRLRIIHRDLKTSNILLDSDMNPKISDFGMARIFGDNDTKGKTNRVVGTFGYMSPEYAMGGLFSEKSDVFSFGVIILEIISGKKNIPYFESDQDSLNLLGNAWNLWNEGKSMELLDSTLVASCSSSEVTRCLQMGLLCVQERAMDRPNMSNVAAMLSNQSFPLPFPNEPAFWSQLSSTDADTSSSRQRHYSTIDSTLTISEVHAR